MGDDIASVVGEYGDRTRVEASGVLLLRSMCKLTHKGHQQYAKGDGHAFDDYLRLKWPHIRNRFYNPYAHTLPLALKLTLNVTGVWDEPNTAKGKIGYVRPHGNFITLLAQL